MQLSCFDPAKDHTGQPVRGFPCLQQVGLSHDGDKRIAVHAFYPTQYIFDRGYGNYLGLCHLGSYIAHQTGLQFARLNCYIGEPHLGDVNKRDLARLAKLRRSAARGTPWDTVMETTLTFRDYQKQAILTNRVQGEDLSSIIVPLLGLAGEAGSLLSEYKKWMREGDRYRPFTDQVSEEIGDILWYLANIAEKEGLDLQEIAEENLAKIADRFHPAQNR